MCVGVRAWGWVGWVGTTSSYTMMPACNEPYACLRTSRQELSEQADTRSTCALPCNFLKSWLHREMHAPTQDVGRKHQKDWLETVRGRTGQCMRPHTKGGHET